MITTTNIVIFMILWAIFVYSMYVFVGKTTNNKQDMEKFGNSHSNPNSNTKGGFSWDNKWMGRQALDCYTLSPGDCMNYGNCGLCLKNGTKTCVPGDEQGPLFKDDCQKWAYTDYNERHIFGERVTTVSDPWSVVLPDYEAVYPSRQVVQTL